MPLLNMGILGLLTSPFKAFLILCLCTSGWAAESKHKRGEGLMLPPKTGKLPTPKKPAVKAGKSKLSSPQGRPMGKHAGSVPARTTVPIEKKACSPMRLERLFKMPRPESPQVSARGVFYLDGTPGDRQVYEQTGAGIKPTALTSIDGGIESYRASADGKSIVAIPNQSGGLWIGSEGKLEEIALPEAAKAESAAWSQDGTWIAFTAPGTGSDFLLFRFDLAERKLSLLATLNGRHLVEDVSPDAKAIALRHLSGDNRAEVILWKQDGKPLLHFTEPVSPSAPHAVFSNGSDGIFFLSGISEAPHLVFGLISGSVKPVSEMEMRVEGFGVDAHRGRLVFSHGLSTVSEWGGWEISESGTKGRKLNVPSSQGFISGSPAVEKSSVAGKVAFFFIRSHERRPQQVWRWGGSREENWTPLPEAEKAEGCWPTASLADIDPAKSLRGYTYLPKDLNVNTPFIVLLKAQSFRPQFSPEILYLVQRGFGILALNASGASEAEAAALWLGKKKTASPSRIFLLGEKGTESALGTLRLVPSPFRDGMVLADSALETYRQAVVRFESTQKEKGPR